jgi:hypothetical protein
MSLVSKGEKMGLTNFPNGISSFGVPILGAADKFITGDVYFVDSGDADALDSIGAGTKDVPFATIDYAVGQCTASNGDYIIVLPGHAEAVDAAAGLALDVAGITVVGIGDGTDTPTVTLGTVVTADVDINAANVTIENIHFVAAFADIAVCLDVNATDFTALNCRFTEATDLNFKICIQDAAAAASSRIKVIGCYALCPDAANTHFINFAGTPDGCIVKDNILIGDWGTMAVGGAGVITYAVIKDNVIYNAAATVDGCINLAATATGIVVGNDCAGAAAQANGITATACVISRNYYGVLAEDLSGILDPIAT